MTKLALPLFFLKLNFRNTLKTKAHCEGFSILIQTGVSVLIDCCCSDLIEPLLLLQLNWQWVLRLGTMKTWCIHPARLLFVVKATQRWLLSASDQICQCRFLVLTSLLLANVGWSLSLYSMKS